MKASELRIGNKVWYENPHSDRTIIEIEFPKELDYCFEYEPVKLNEDWLLRFGFNNLNYGYELALELDRLLQLVVSNGDYYPQLIQLPEMSGLESQVVSLNLINYVHELQNLWYVLTGEELVAEPARTTKTI